MKTQTKKTIHRAKYALVDPHTLIQNAAVAVTGDGRVSNAASWREVSGDSGAGIVDWGAAVILPGLINAHTHLELTSLGNRLVRFDSFTDWLTRLIAGRRSWSPEESEASVMKGVALSLASGTTTVGDISSAGIARSATRGRLLRRVIFEESISFAPGQADSKLSEMDRILSREKSDHLYRRGISPHAPYSVSRELYLGLAKLARERNLPLATHLAETTAEIQFLQTGTGEFRDFLEALGAFTPGWEPPGLHPVAYLHALGVLGPLSLLIHCNYLDREAIDMIFRSGSHIVYCPRSHAFFNHPPHPIRQAIDMGINVALGTDSLASNKTLSILDEMRFLSRKRKDLKSTEILQAATINGAKALNSDDSLGALKAGYWADMTILELPETIEAHRIQDQILEGAGKCTGTVVDGVIAWASSRNDVNYEGMGARELS